MSAELRARVLVRVQVRRCTRWDPYPQQEPVETCMVTVRPGRDGVGGKDWRARVIAALAEQHPKWRVASPIMGDIELVQS